MNDVREDADRVDSIVCPLKCRHRVIMRSGVANCLRWGRVLLVQTRDESPYGGPQWYRRDNCRGAVPR
jgi:hypothetical protein